MKKEGKGEVDVKGKGEVDVKGWLARPKFVVFVPPHTISKMWTIFLRNYSCPPKTFPIRPANYSKPVQCLHENIPVQNFENFLHNPYQYCPRQWPPPESWVIIGLLVVVIILQVKWGEVM